MNETIPIQRFSDDTLRDALREALISETPVPAVCDLVSKVDWSSLEMADPDVVSLLGDLEQLTSDLTDDVVAASDFLNRTWQLVVTVKLPPDFSAFSRADSVRANSSATRGAIRRRIGESWETERFMLYA